MKVIYVAAPLRGKTPEETEANRRRGSALCARIAAEHRVAVASTWPMLAEHWIADHWPEEQMRELGLEIDCTIIERCDELWLCGPVQPLTQGMQRERDHAEARAVRVVDKRGVYEIDESPPKIIPFGVTIEKGTALIPGRWYRITEIDPEDFAPSLRIGSVLLCRDGAGSGQIAPDWHGYLESWVADYRGQDAGYGTLVTGVVEVPAPTGAE